MGNPDIINPIDLNKEFLPDPHEMVDWSGQFITLSKDQADFIIATGISNPEEKPWTELVAIYKTYKNSQQTQSTWEAAKKSLIALVAWIDGVKRTRQ